MSIIKIYSVIIYVCALCIVIPGLSLTADNRLQLVSDIPEVIVPTSNNYFDPSVVYTEFLYLTDKVKELLQLCDLEVLMETCRNLMASDVHKISLFSDEYVEKLSKYTSIQSLVWELTAYSTWSNHSVLRMLASCCEKAVKLIDKFDSRFDPFQSLASYDVPSCLHSNMLPSEDSEYTLLAVKIDEGHVQSSLQFVYKAQSLLMDKCNVTQHCFQLFAVKHNPTVIYWVIPKCIASLVSPRKLYSNEDLFEKGIVEISVCKQPIASEAELQSLFGLDSESGYRVCKLHMYLIKAAYSISISIMCNWSKKRQESYKTNLNKSYK